MHKALFKENEKIDKVNDSKTLILGYCFPVQSAIDHLASFEKMKPTPSRVGYKSLILFSSRDVVVAFASIIFEFTVIFASVDPRAPPRTHYGKLKFCSIFVEHSKSPMPIIESEMHLISADDAKVNKYPNLPPFSDFGKYARNWIGTLILQANADFEKKRGPN
jgi:hypothetical protein